MYKRTQQFKWLRPSINHSELWKFANKQTQKMQNLYLNVNFFRCFLSKLDIISRGPQRKNDRVMHFYCTIPQQGLFVVVPLLLEPLHKVELTARLLIAHPVDCENLEHLCNSPPPDKFSIENTKEAQSETI